MHPLTDRIEERVPTSQSLEGLRPLRRSGARLAFATDGGEYLFKCLINSSGSEQPKVPDCVPIPLENVLGPEINKLFKGASDLNAFSRIFIFN
jgi:hypothetical protein